jgi:two-component system sensor histidine kinase DesK
VDAPARKSGFDAHEQRWFSLAYLVFAYVPMLFAPQAAARMMLPTLLATALFLPAYFAFQRRGEASPWPYVAAAGAIGLALIPFNPGGNTFAIYALAMGAMALPARTAMRLTLALVAAMALLFFLLMPRTQTALAMTVVMVAISVMVVAGILFGRARERRDAQLRLTQDEVRRLAGMAERERIGRDLHDLLGHTLSVIALKSELAGKLLERDPAAAREQIRDVENVTRQALAQVREAVAGIRAAGLQAELAAARLALLAADVRLDQRLAPVAIAPAAEAALALGVRESVTNVIRHAQARRVEVELCEEDGTVRLSIADDGRGGAQAPGNGLTGMRERLAAVGGTLDIESSPAIGTRLVLRVPQGRAA